MRMRKITGFAGGWLLATVLALPAAGAPPRTAKPPLHGQHWMAITGKPLGATAGAMIFQKGGNAVDAACAMIAASATVWDTLSWGGETQALIFNPNTRKVIAINALGVAPTGATAKFYRDKGMQHPPEFGPLAAITPGTPGGILTMLAEFGTLSLADVLAPSITLAEGYPIEAQIADNIEEEKKWIKQWPDSKRVFLVHEGKKREAPHAGEIFRQPELAATLRKLVEAERAALAAGKDRKAAIYAAYDRFYKGDIAREFVRGSSELGGLITLDDLANWRVHVEEPVHTQYKGIDVYKLNTWVQGPAMLQTLNILENFDVKAMGYNSVRYIHTLYQAMNLAFADRDFYYGDPYYPPEEPLKGLLSKDYARARAKLIQMDRNDPDAKPGDPYPFQGANNPFAKQLQNWRTKSPPPTTTANAEFERNFYVGTTSVEAADAKGWVVSVTPSGGWVPAVIAGRTGVGMSQRAQAFVLDPADGPFNVIEPGKRPRATLSPGLALKGGRPYLSFAVQGGDAQDQDLLQFFLNIVEFGMTPQEAAEAPNFVSYQMRESFDKHESIPGRVMMSESTSSYVKRELRKMGYSLTFTERSNGPINGILFDREHGTMWGGSSHNGEDHGIAW
jgi:gamma-glutamyltranspeptidase/glutathione hydrolase